MCRRQFFNEFEYIFFVNQPSFGVENPEIELSYAKDESNGKARFQIPLSNEAINEVFQLLTETNLSYFKLSELFVGLRSSKMNIYRLPMSTRSRNILMRSNIENLEKLSKLSIKEIEDLRNLGTNSLHEIISLYLENLVADISTPEDESISHHEPEGSAPELIKWPSELVELLDEFSNDFSQRDIHIINGRSALNPFVTHSEIGESWGISRQRVHQIENHIRERLSQDKRIEGLANLVLAEASYIGLNEARVAMPWLNLGISFPPVGVSVLQLIIFSERLALSEGWILTRQGVHFQELLSNMRNSEPTILDDLISGLRASSEVKNYLVQKIADSGASFRAFERVQIEDGLEVVHINTENVDEGLSKIFKEFNGFA